MIRFAAMKPMAERQQEDEPADGGMIEAKAEEIEDGKSEED